MANQYRKDISKLKELSSEKELKLFRQYQTGDMEAKKQLIDSQLKLILNLCEKYKPKEYHDDLVQMCNVALLRRFSDLKKDSKLKRFDPDYLRKKKKVDKTMRLSYFTSKICRSVVSKFFSKRRNTVDRNVPLEECIRMPESVEILVHNKINAQTLIQLLDKLPDIQREILMGLFGINCQKRTLQELSRKLDITITRIWKIEQKALKKLNTILSKNPDEVLSSYKKKG